MSREDHLASLREFRDDDSDECEASEAGGRGARSASTGEGPVWGSGGGLRESPELRGEDDDLEATLVRLHRDAGCVGEAPA